MMVSIVGIGGNPISSFKVKDDCRVRDLLSKLRDITGFPTFMQALMYGSIELGRDDFLKDHSIEASSVLTHVALHEVFIIAGVYPNNAHIYRVSTGKCVQTFEGHNDAVLGVNFSQDGSLVMTGSAQGSVKVWDEANGKCLHTLFAHNGEVVSCVFSKHGDLALTASTDETAQVWYLEREECLQTFEAEDFVNSAVFCHEEMRVLTASPRMIFQLWDRMTGACLQCLSGSPSVNEVYWHPRAPAPLLSQDGTMILGVLPETQAAT
jgi:WD40 repeat protein